MVAWNERIWPPILSFNEINTGIEPNMSITANKVKLIVSNSLLEILAMLGIFFSNVAKMMQSAQSLYNCFRLSAGITG
jgi:hypothetical protein